MGNFLDMYGNFKEPYLISELLNAILDEENYFEPDDNGIILSSERCLSVHPSRDDPVEYHSEVEKLDVFQCEYYSGFIKTALKLIPDGYFSLVSEAKGILALTGDTYTVLIAPKVEEEEM